MISIYDLYLYDPKMTGGLLLILEFTADSVVLDVLPIDFGSSQRQRSAQRLEGRLRHRLVVLADRRLVRVLGLLDDVHKFIGQLFDVL